MEKSVHIEEKEKSMGKSFKEGLKKYKSVDVRGYCVLCLSFKNNTLFSLQPLRLLVGQEGSKPVKVFGTTLQ